MEKGWKLIATDLELDPPQPLSLYLGCAHERTEVRAGSTIAQVMTYNMEGFRKSSVERCVCRVMSTRTIFDGRVFGAYCNSVHPRDP